MARPQRVLAVAAALAVVGWGLDTQTRVESDVQKLVPQNLPALQDLNALEKSTGVGGEIDVHGHERQPHRPEGRQRGWRTTRSAWSRSSATRRDRGCGKAELCPAFSLPDLFRSGLKGQTKQSIETLLDAVPPYFSQGVLTGDRRTATLAFGVKLMPLDRQQQVIERMRARARPAPGRDRSSSPACRCSRRRRTPRCRRCGAGS